MSIHLSSAFNAAFIYDNADWKKKKSPSTTVELIETESRIVVPKAWVKEEEGMGKLLVFNGYI